MATTISERIERANERAFRRLIDAEPILIDVAQAKYVIPGMAPNMVLHAGPPIEWHRMCPTMKHGIIGGVLYERWAASPVEAEHLATSGQIRLGSCHDYSTVGSMAGVTTPSMWVYVVQERRWGGRAYSTVYEGRGKTLAFGSYGPETINRLRWMEATLGPALKRVINALKDGLPLKPILARAVHMGDEGHNRYVASTLWFMDKLTRSFLSLDMPSSEIESILDFMTGEHYNSFLTPAMAGCKAIADAAHNVTDSTIVTAMARNGTEFGIRVSGLGRDWFTAAAQEIRGVYFTGHNPAEANPDIGDSTITETVGLGGFALAAAPLTMQLVGERFAQAAYLEGEMSEITVGRNQTFTIPYLDFRGTPTGIDIRKVVKTNIAPLCITAIASIHPDRGMIGAGIVRQPLECFQAALSEFATRIRE